jgi:hypothetical protein
MDYYITDSFPEVVSCYGGVECFKSRAVQENDISVINKFYMLFYAIKYFQFCRIGILISVSGVTRGVQIRMQLGPFSEVLNKQCQNNNLNPSKYSLPCDIQSFSLLIQFSNASS